MLKIVHTISDILFPPRPSELCVRNISLEHISTLSEPQRYGEITFLLSYQHPIVTALITENKFHHNKTAAELLANVLTQWLDVHNHEVLIIPIPLSSKRKKSRGYNQVEEITSRLPSRWKNSVVPSLLLRTRHTEAQTTLGRADRLKNMSNAFLVHGNQVPPPTVPIIIVDDVVTTGATLIAAKTALKTAYPEATIILLSLAH